MDLPAHLKPPEDHLEHEWCAEPPARGREQPRLGQRVFRDGNVVRARGEERDELAVTAPRDAQAIAPSRSGTSMMK